MLGALEGLLFVAGEDGLDKDELCKLLDISLDEVTKLLDDLNKDLESEKRGLRLTYLGNKYKLSTKKEHKKYYELLVENEANAALTQAALETLVIIAYKQPVSVGMIDEIRGVASRDMVRKLLFRGFIEMAGRSDILGRPMLYKTTDKFLDYFNLKSIDNLPELKIESEELSEEEDLFLSKYKDEN